MPTGHNGGRQAQPGNQRGGGMAGSSSSGAASQSGTSTGTSTSTTTGTDDSNKSLHQKGRSKIPWSKDVWDRIDQAVEHEVKRTRVCARFLPKRPVPPKTTSVPTDAYSASAPPNPVLTVDEGATTRLCEYYVEFELTPQQVDQEEADFKQLGHSTAVTLATKAANTLAQAEDLIILQGQNATSTTALAAVGAVVPIVGSTLFSQGYVLTLNNTSPSDTGLLDFPIGKNVPPGAGDQVPTNPVPPLVPVNPLAGPPPGVIYGSGTFAAVSNAYSKLQAAGHYGPYALVLETIPYADTYAPLSDLTVTADRIKPLMTAGFFGTGTLPPNPPPPPVAPYYGVMVSLGGNSMDLVVGLEPMAAFMQEDTNGNFRFRVLERFALRIKDPTAIVILQFN
jgi:uncharacterized linocin/CFP29 family protein